MAKSGKSLLDIDRDVLIPLAGKYVWWKTPEEAVSQPDRVIAQVMNIGDYDDVQDLTDLVGDAVLQDVLYRAEIGQLNERSWVYWHHRLGTGNTTHVPPMPVRRVK